MHNFYEEIYDDCQEILNPHIRPQSHGGCSITKDNLIPSVIESLEYLVEFWLANKDKDHIDLCGASK
jgi:hypothetical protein